MTEYFDFGGKDTHKTFNSYESNCREPSKVRLKEISDLYEVSVNVVEKYGFSNPIDVIYSLMWLEEKFLYYEINFDTESYEKTKYNEIIKNVIDEWKEMRDKRENYEISDEEYLD